MTQKIIPSDEMLADLSLMGDKEFGKKWGTSLRIPIRIRKEYGIKSFNNLHGTKDHKLVDGIEYKYCASKHWVSIDKFTKCKTRLDGLSVYCQECGKKKSREQYYSSPRALEVAREWRKTEKGKQSLRTTWRRSTAQKKAALVDWNKQLEKLCYIAFGGKCAYCSKEVPLERAEFDHVLPISLGGLTEKGNMVVCCSECNHGPGGKFSKKLDEWLLERFGEDKAIYIYVRVTNILKFLSELN